jgi:hypothetical protein
MAATSIQDRVTRYREMANVMRVLADNTKREQAEIEYHRMAAEYEGLAMEIEKLNKR